MGTARARGAPPAPPGHGRGLHSSKQGFSAAGKSRAAVEKWHCSSIPSCRAAQNAVFLRKEVFFLEVENIIPC